MKDLDNAGDFTMYADDLLSKWGFSDGDSLSNYIYSTMGIFDYQYDIHKLLHELVIMYLLPKIKSKVEVMFIATIHNPIRAEYIDGVPYTNHYELNDNGLLGDVTVNVSAKTIFRHMERQINETNN